MKRYLPLMVIVVLSLSVFLLDLHSFLSIEALLDNQLLLDQYVKNQYGMSLLIYTMVYILVVGLSIPGASFLTLAGGILFGRWVGFLTVIVAATIGALIIFESAKLASKDIIAKRAGHFVQKMQKGFQKDAFSYLLTIRLMPIFPFVAVNLVSALFQISRSSFVLATFFGIIPGTFVYISLGVGLKEAILNGLSVNVILSPQILLALMGLAVLSLLPIVYRKIKRN